MDAVGVLHRLEILGINLEVNGDKLRFQPASKVPPDLLEQMRQHKPAIMGLLHDDATKGVGQRYIQKHPGPTSSDTELAEIETTVLSKGVCLLYSHTLDDFVAFRPDDDARKDVPPGFVAYTLAELQELFGDPNNQHAVSTLKMVHAIKKAGGGRVLWSKPISEDNPKE